ncbi:SAM-dependent methyltransferase [Streptomyces sp. NRRL F-5126]|uniref:SAM-dependent methyltransferase n=1 Tax=Streptomyces sp. NRRL F-5126 TaxID=1463857 RepID=UPI0004C9D6BB|nr:SAM-dependent methyltransferase [Streptomyces sp. NRRL F-5126]
MDESWCSPRQQVDTSHASSARLYDTYQGGKSGYGVDRDVAGEVAALLGDTKRIATSARAFHTRAVRAAAGELGVDQFLDVGAGVPNEPHTHQVAQAVHPGAAVVYVDNDLVVLRQSEALLSSGTAGRTDYIQADLRSPDAILKEARRTLDLTRPVGLILCSVLHFITDEEDPRSLVRALMAPLVPGSCLILSHGTDDFAPAAWRAVEDIYRQQGIGTQIRGRAAIEALLDGHDPVEPGLVEVHRWRQDPATASADPDDHVHCYGVVAIKSSDADAQR